MYIFANSFMKKNSEVQHYILEDESNLWSEACSTIRISNIQKYI